MSDGLGERVLGQVGGERTLTDLRHVAQLLHETARRDDLGLVALLAWLQGAMAEDTPASTGARSRRLDSDAAAVQRLVPGVSGIAPQLRSTVQMVIQGRNATTTAVGITPDYGPVANFEIAGGRFIADADVRTAARVILAALITYAVWFASPGVYGEVTGPDRHRAKEAVIDLLVRAAGGAVA